MMVEPDRFENTFRKYYMFFLKVFLVLMGYLIVKFVMLIFVFDMFRIPTESMSPTLIPGDKIYVDKLTFGARLYESINSSVRSREPKTRRVAALGSIKHNDIFVFNFPHPYSWSKIEFKINLVYCKRCVALPGDTISIVNGFYRNSATDYVLGYIPEQKLLSDTRDSLINDGRLHSFPLDSTKYGWTIKNFGKLFVPAANTTIRLDSQNYVLYQLPIEYETGKQLHLQNGELQLGDDTITDYTFTQDYYFAVGDNVLNSQDSRYWGFVPEKHIIGIAKLILYSKSPNNGEYLWNRFLKKVK